MKKYFYLVNERNETVVEYYTEKANAETLAELSSTQLYSHFPYEEYGYTDPYNFIADWAVYNTDNRLLEVTIENGIVVLKGDE